MSWLPILAMMLTALLVLIFLGVPVFASFLTVNLATIFVLFGTAGFGLFTSSIVTATSAPSFAALPLFILMGEVLFLTGAADSLFDAADRALSSIRGRQWAVVTGLSAVFGALSGSAVAVAAMLGKSVMPQIVAKGYDESVTISAVLGGASLAPIIPPSLLAIIIGSLTAVSIEDLLVAGILPGILLGGMMLLYTLGLAALKPGLVPENEEVADTQGAPGIGGALAAAAPIAIIIFSVLGLIVLGIATPTESAATGVLGAVIAALFKRKFDLGVFYSALKSTALVTAMIMMIVASSNLFGQLLAFTGAAGGIVALVGDLDAPPAAIFIVLLLLPFILCMFIDQLAFLMVAIPIYTPIVALNGFNAVWFWMLFLIILTVGSITPPFGYTLFALKGANPSLTISSIYRAAWPVVGLFVAGVAIMALAPEIITFVPELFDAAG